MTLLVAPDPNWPAQASNEIARWSKAVEGLIKIHHIGSTSIAGMPARPVIDLMPEFIDDKAKRAAQFPVEKLGYEWLGEYGLKGRRYARFDDPETGARRIQAHCYAKGHLDVRRHLAFRDALRTNPALRAGYASVKGACAARHPEGGQAYSECKSGWIDKIETLALERLS